MNGIIVDGKVYEVIKGECCKDCAFYHDELKCAFWCTVCEVCECYFRFSQSLTDKLK